ncbi:MAG: hypothetical protein H0X62_09755 [Bacteroidetes bacterium]|nr:hypothetical protein [Bacteroidota bacterium]
MKTKIALLCLMLSTGLLTNCKKHNTVFDVYFYTDKDNIENHLNLYIDIISRENCLL